MRHRHKLAGILFCAILLLSLSTLPVVAQDTSDFERLNVSVSVFDSLFLDSMDSLHFQGGSMEIELGQYPLSQAGPYVSLPLTAEFAFSSGVETSLQGNGYISVLYGLRWNYRATETLALGAGVKIGSGYWHRVGTGSESINTGYAQLEFEGLMTWQPARRQTWRNTSVRIIPSYSLVYRDSGFGNMFSISISTVFTRHFDTKTGE